MALVQSGQLESQASPHSRAVVGKGAEIRYVGLLCPCPLATRSACHLQHLAKDEIKQSTHKYKHSNHQNNKNRELRGVATLNNNLKISKNKNTLQKDTM